MDAKPPNDLLLREEVFRIQGAVFDVNREMGRGFLEPVYQECLALEFETRGIPFRALPQLRLAYKGRPLQKTYCPDFICFDAIIIELKAVRETVAEHRAQVLNYLKATGLRVGLLVNFGANPRATVQRLVL
ncbi:GxxExxY protein [Phenylobacterium sp.]|uniref:GxxExxY protein n=1 Tax=Phenylobacterium sp. TaxID=1871053 RepID=UPI0025CC486E|nr:GxxExxY protein [Phenylobacterium sp.]MBX3486072.1 GxxExxY protein [Phenylobacterium sp.]MCW5760477.1 GxxExxY protein [Phenylobacterium sp.]